VIKGRIGMNRRSSVRSESRMMRHWSRTPRRVMPVPCRGRRPEITHGEVGEARAQGAGMMEPSRFVALRNRGCPDPSVRLYDSELRE
jgi:hypothetical protein